MIKFFVNFDNLHYMKMKLTFFFLVLSAISFGQITLTDQHFCGANEQYLFSNTIDPTIDYATTGANYTWDFSALTRVNQDTFVTRPMSQVNGFSILQFGSFAPTAYKATYFNTTTDLPIAQISQFLPVNITEMNLFTKKQSSKITSVGYEFRVNGQGIGFRSDTIESRYVLPLNYNDMYQSRGYTSLDMNPIYDAKWKQYRQRQSTVDGWGTITTPFGTFPCLRLHHIIHEKDSIYISTNGNGLWLPLTIPVTHEYEWRSTDDKEAILRIRTNEVLSNEVVTSIEYRDNLANLGLLKNEFQVSVFPNPVINSLHVQSEKSAFHYMITAENGQVFKSGICTENEAIIDVSTISCGVYFLILINGTEISSIKFSKKS